MSPRGSTTVKKQAKFGVGISVIVPRSVSGVAGYGESKTDYTPSLS